MLFDVDKVLAPSLRRKIGYIQTLGSLGWVLQQ
jgi:hypothetical protein